MTHTLPVVRNRHLVRELDRGRVKELLLVVALVAVMLLPLLAYVWYHMEWVRVGYEVERLKSERVVQAELRERLRIERSTLESLARVEREARDKLGLVPAGGSSVTMSPEPPAAVASGRTRPRAPAPPAAPAEAVR